MAHPATGPMTAPAIHARFPLSESELESCRPAFVAVAAAREFVADGPGVMLVSGG